jgi:hypothetical protein
MLSLTSAKDSIKKMQGCQNRHDTSILHWGHVNVCPDLSIMSVKTKVGKSLFTLGLPLLWLMMKMEFNCQSYDDQKNSITNLTTIEKMVIENFQSPQWPEIFNRHLFDVWLWPFTLKNILRKKKNYGNSNISPCKNIIFKKNSSKRNQTPSRYWSQQNLLSYYIL